MQAAGQAGTVRAPMLAILFITVFLDLVGFGIIVPFLAYYVESFGARAAVVGLLMSSYSLAQFVFAPIWGRVSDRVGRRPILLLVCYYTERKQAYLAGIG